ncbi:MAG: hypothetical protein EBE86_000300 [Hormoscilla sp. GUM202]|nr:hypothetical protein [Hormoscilla sp. GUM202]
MAGIKEYPKKISLVKEKAKENWNVSVSKDTIKRILKNENMSWRRIRKRVGRVRERPGVGVSGHERGARTHGRSRKKERIKKIKRTIEAKLI